MISSFMITRKFFDGKELKLNNKKMEKVIGNYTFLYPSTQKDIIDKKFLYENISKSNFVLLKQYREEAPNGKTYFIIGFQKTIIIVERSYFQILLTLFSTNKVIFCFLTKIDDFDFNFIDKCYMINETNNSQFLDEIKYFNLELMLSPKCGKDMNNFWKIIMPCISGYLIKESYEKTKINRLDKFITNDNLLTTINPEKINEDEFIELRQLGIGTLFITKLIYHIEKEELFAIKKAQSINDIEIPKLINREIKNHSKINHPFLPKFIGTNNNNDYIIMEFINGKVMSNTIKQKLNYSEKITIIFEIMIIIEYLHRNHFIYRDLKPNNIIIDLNNTAVLIDFDRMIEYDEIKNTTTNDFNSFYIAPEVNSNNFSYECDIYSLGLIIFYMFQNEEPSKSNLNNYLASEKNDFIKNMIEKCTNKIINERPSILEVIITYFSKFYENIKINNLFEKYINKLNTYYNIDKPLGNYHKLQYYFGLLYENEKIVKHNFEKAVIYYTLAANGNIADAQFKLALIYYKGELVKKNINKAINFFTLAANQNNHNAQYYLGDIYYKGKFVERDIKKAVHYLTLAANQNDPDAQFYLGFMYFTGKFVERDIKKAVHYFTLAADQNDPRALYNLGVIYYKGIFVSANMNQAIHYLTLASAHNFVEANFLLGRIYEKNIQMHNINKALYYYSLAAQQNHLDAQYKLGLIYCENKLIPRNIKMAIYYFTLASNQNDSSAQFNLGIIYFNGISVQRDIKKAIYYFTLSANQNHYKAQFLLGNIYTQGKYVPRDINKAIHYLTPVANQNFSDAQFILGEIFLFGQTIPRDIHKAIHYLTLASKQNHPYSQLFLGVIYISGEYISRDVSKAIHYFEMAANQNLSQAQFFLGCIYGKGEFGFQIVSKALFYYKLAANQNNAEAQFELGLIYAEGKLVPRNVDQAIHYYKLAARQNHHRAQFYLGAIYFTGNIIPIDKKKGIFYFTLSKSQIYKNMQKGFDRFNLDGSFIPRDRIKGVFYFIKSSNNKFPHSHFTIGYLYQFGICVEKNIQKAIHHYKEASSFNYQYAKNNLGIIYKHGIDIEKNIGYAILYFEEAIKYGDNLVAKYNLAHLYFYEEHDENSIEKSIKLLIESSNMNFLPSIILLCIISFKIFGFKISNIIKELNKYQHISNKLRESMLEIIQKEKLDDIDTFEKVFHYLSNIDFIYDYQFCAYPLEVAHYLNQIDNKIKNINSDFYEGFGILL